MILIIRQKFLVKIRKKEIPFIPYDRHIVVMSLKGETDLSSLERDPLSNSNYGKTAYTQ